jgi:hypothetical protein
LIAEAGPQQESGLSEPAVGFPEGPKTSTPRASPSLTGLAVADSGKNIPLDHTDILGLFGRAGGSSSWADAMEVDHQRDVAHAKEAGVQDLSPVPQEMMNVEVSGEQEVLPPPQYNIPHPYSVDAFQQLPFRRQKECAFRCGKTLETDAFGEAQPLSKDLKKSLRMQMDEFDKERRRRASEAREAPPQKNKTPYRKPSSGQSRSRSRHAPSQDYRALWFLLLLQQLSLAYKNP